MSRSERSMRDLTPGQRPGGMVAGGQQVYGSQVDDLEATSAGSSNEEDPDALRDPPSAPKLLKLIVSSTRKSQDVEPEDYLGAIAELLFCTICMSFAITYFFRNELLDDNPIKNMVGYNNPCAFWDNPPALYFAAISFCPMVYLGLQYVCLDSVRARLTFTRGRLGRTCTFINYIYGFSQCMVLGIFVIRPHIAGDRTTESVQEMHWYMRAHSACFLQFVPVLCLTMTSNYFEGWFSGIPKCKPTAFGWLVLFFYILATTLETIFATYAIFTYEGNYRRNERHVYYRVNPKLMQVIDYCWFASLPFAAAWQPPAPNLKFQYQLEDMEGDGTQKKYERISNDPYDSEGDDHWHGKSGYHESGDDTIADQQFDKCLVGFLFAIAHVAPIVCLVIWLWPEGRGPLVVNDSVLLGIGLGVPILSICILQWPQDANYDPNPFPSSFFGFTLRDASFGMFNFTMKMAAFAKAAGGSDFRTKYAQWFVDQTEEDDPTVGVKFGGNTTMHYSWQACQEKLASIGDRINEDIFQRESELALAVQNNLMWPDAGKFALGFSNEDHAFIRPYIARMFDLGEGQPDGWTKEMMKDMFSQYFAELDNGVLHNNLVGRNMWDVVDPSKSDTLVTQMVLKILHKIALDMDISDVDAKELAALQTTQLLPSACPGRIARTYCVWSCIARPARWKAKHFMNRYKTYIVRKFSNEDWSDDKKLTLMASGFLDAMLQAGGRSVPLAIDLVMGYILSANRPECLNDVDFTEEAHIRALLFECMRYHPPVTVLPSWIRDSPDDEEWKHDLICLDRALADPDVFEDPNEFKIDRENGESHSMAWGDFALVNNDKAHPHSHACPGKNLSINLVIAFVQAYQEAGEWDLKSDDIKFNFYGTHGWQITLPKEE